ncbi:hypothetical protein CLOM_g6974, partial [Closterium sp. NIES-68]
KYIIFKLFIKICR